jgi:hypothetical protein
MRHRLAGEGDLYDAEEEINYNEKQLAIFANILDLDPLDIDSMDIEVVVVRLRAMWKYSSDLRGSIEPTYTNNAIPRFLSKMNASLTDRARKANWNYALAKAAKNG